MADRTLKLIMAKNQHGHSLSHTSQLTELSIDKPKEILGQATSLTHREVSIIFHMKQGGHFLAQISQEYGVELEVLEQFLGNGQEQEPDGGCYIRTWSEEKKHGEFSYSKGGTSRKQK